MASTTFDSCAFSLLPPGPEPVPGRRVPSLLSCGCSGMTVCCGLAGLVGCLWNLEVGEPNSAEKVLRSGLAVAVAVDD